MRNWRMKPFCSEVTLGDNPYKSRDFRIQVAKRDCISEVITV